MKNIFYILLLLPTIIFAQYPSNSGQKITLGEQTTADGLVFRGVASIDTVSATSKITRANKQDTSAYLLLDTVTNLLWHYKIGSNTWTQAGGGVSVSSFSAGTTGLTPSTATTGAVTLGGTLAVANGGTNTSTLTANKVMVGNGTSGVLTPTNLHWDNTNSRLGIGSVGPTHKLHVVGNGLFTDNVAANYYVINAASENRGGLYPYNAVAGGGSTDYSVGLFSPGEIFFASGGLATKRYTLNTSGTSTFTDLKVKGTGNYGYLNIDNSVTDFGGGAVSVLQNGVNCGGFGVQGALFGTSSKNVIFYSDVAKDIIFATIPTSTSSIITRMTITSDGNIGIGTGSPLALLNVMGTVRINSASAPDANYYLQLENSSSQKAKANAWDTYSDKRIKTDIQPIFNAIDKVNLLNPVYYQKHDSYVENDFLNIDYDNSVKSLGFIAQEVYNIIPEAVNTGTTNELWAMDYTKIIPILTKAIQEQQALIKALEQRIINLENK